MLRITAIQLALMLLVLMPKGFGQDIQVQVVDASTRVGIPYANIYFPALASGTITDAEGMADLKLAEGEDSLLVEISSLSYRDKQVNLHVTSADRAQVISLSPVSYTLSEAVIKESKVAFKEKRLGEVKGGNAQFDVTRMAEPGSEIGTIIRTPGRCKIARVGIRMKKVEVDSFLIELNIYDYRESIPGALLQGKRIFRTISGEESDNHVIVDLSDQNIWIDADVFVALKILRLTPTSAESIFISAKTKYGNGFLRQPLGGWKDSYLYPNVYLVCRFVK